MLADTWRYIDGLLLLLLLLLVVVVEVVVVVVVVVVLYIQIHTPGFADLFVLNIFMSRYNLVTDKYPY